MNIYPNFDFLKREFYLIFENEDITHITRKFYFMDRCIIKTEDSIQLRLITHGIEFMFDFRRNDRSNGVCMPVTLLNLYRELVYCDDVNFIVQSYFDVRLYEMNTKTKEIETYYEFKMLLRHHGVILD